MAQDNTKQAIKDAVDIAEYVSQYTSLVPAGNRMKGLSPFTNEKTPSFFVNPQEGFYYCFSSQKGGDIFSFVQEIEGVDFKHALRIVAEYAGIDLAPYSAAAKDERTPLYHALEAAHTVYRKHLSAEARKYLYSRGITDASIDRWEIGFAPEGWNTVCTAGMTNEREYIAAGLCIKKDSSLYDRFRDRILFPFHDSRGRMIGYSGRAFTDDSGAKYINSSESPLFKKSEFLYGMHLAKSIIRKNNVAMLVEGPVDAIMAHQAGYDFTVATSGTAVTAQHLRQIKRLTNRLIITLDSDNAGIRAALRALTLCLSVGMDAKVVLLPGGADPAETIRKNPDIFRECFKNARPAFEYLFAYIRKEYGDKKEDIIRGVREKIIPVLLTVRDPLIRDSAIRDTAEFCSLSSDAVLQSMRDCQPLSVGRESDLNVAGTRTAARKQAVAQDTRSAIEKRTQKLLHGVGMGRVYLKEHAAAIRPETVKALDEITAAETVPVFSGKMAKEWYEIRFPEKESRNEKVLTEFTDTVTLLRSELRKRKEMDNAEKGRRVSDI